MSNNIDKGYPEFVFFDDVTVIIRKKDNKEVADIKISVGDKNILVDKNLSFYEFLKNLSWRVTEANDRGSVSGHLKCEYSDTLKILQKLQED